MTRNPSEDVTKTPISYEGLVHWLYGVIGFEKPIHCAEALGDAACAQEAENTNMSEKAAL